MKWFHRKPKPNPEPTPKWTDPLNPHGDGTLRAGDPLFDAIMRGNVLRGTFGAQGWKFEETGEAPDTDPNQE